MTFEDALQAVMTNPEVIAVVVGAVLAYVGERVAWFEELDSTTKRDVMLAVNLAVPVLATGASFGLGYVGPFETLQVAFEQAVWPALTAGFLAFTSNQTTHRLLYMED